MRLIIKVWWLTGLWSIWVLFGIFSAPPMSIETYSEKTSIIDYVQFMMFEESLNRYLIQPEPPFPVLYLQIFYFIVSIIIRVLISLLLWKLFETIKGKLGFWGALVTVIVLGTILFVPWIDNTGRL